MKKILPFFVDIKTDLQFNSSNSTIIKTKIERETRKCLGFINELKDEIFYKLKKNPIIIFEDLDKIIPAERALDIFSYYVLGQMQFPVIYTFPVTLSYTAGYVDLENSYEFLQLPMIKVKNIDNSICLEGITTLKKLVFKRADENLFNEDALQELIIKTGGSIRDLFWCITHSARTARNRNSEKIERHDTTIALKSLKAEMTRRLESKNDNYEKLLAIHRQKTEIEDRDTMLNFLRAHLVLEYNGERWCDVHPLILDFIQNEE
jgi:hypothetical protein